MRTPLLSLLVGLCWPWTCIAFGSVQATRSYGHVVGQPRTPTFFCAHGSKSSSSNLSSYDGFLQATKLRKALKKYPLFSSLSEMDLDRLVLAMLRQERLVVAKGASIFASGDPADAMYIVQSGKVSVSSSSSSKVVVAAGPGEVFGALDLLFDAPARRDSAVSDADKTDLWVLDKETFQAVLPSKEAAKRVVANDMDQFADYMERNELRTMVKKCPIFKGFGEQDLERCMGTMEKVNFPGNKTILEQGNEDGDAMYFVVSGTLDCIDEQHNGKVVNTLRQGDYFGELTLLFSTPRAVTVKATEPCVLWRLSRQNFEAAVEDYPLSTTAMQAMKTKYQQKTIWRTLLRMSRREIMDTIIASSRPKKKSVSFHSTLSTVVSGMFLLIHIMHFEPKWADEYGRLQIFRITELSLLEQNSYRLVSMLFTATALLGLLRIPKNAPPIRRIAFEYMAWGSVATWTVGDSNVFGHALHGPGFTFDAWSWLGRTAIMGAFVKSFATAVRMLDHSIRGSLRGSQTMPLAFNRISQILVATLFYGALCLILMPAKFMFLDHAYVISTGCPPVINTAQSTCCTAIASMCFGALISTLQFESKIAPKQGSLLALGTAFLLLWDSLKFANRRIFEQAGGTMWVSPFPFNELFWVFYVGTFCYGPLRRLFDSFLSNRKDMRTSK